ncbi:type III-B CRISPR module RAMP protein Cmr1 [Salinactinospora qingdaonensis]|uniref:CRISPR type III-associated protein domain-containing protein n=1 Tax=Salinactinospora qingdaonensis TaxID=702744 RepID=A0ABP7FBV6_9ACTN
MAWTQVRLRVTTPLFNHTDTDGLRVSSLRGPMRFWLRALAGTRVGPHIGTLRQLENTVFGSTDNPAPVRMRLVDPPGAVTAPRPAFLDTAPAEDDGDRVEPAIGYLLGQGLGTIAKGYQITRPYVQPKPGYFTLKLAFSGNDAIDVLTLAALWMTCAYGGVGARTRRGFGGLYILGATPATGSLPGPWDTETLRSPGLSHYAELDTLHPTGVLAQCLPYVDELLATLPDTCHARPWRDDERPTYPVMSTAHTRAGLSSYTAATWDELLAHVGRQYRLFRATRDNSASKSNYSPKVKTPEHLSVVNGDSDRFPLGALGLPVVYSKGGIIGGRRASPLWLRPIGDSGTWRLFSFAFRARFLPEGTTVPMTGREEGVTVTDDDVTTRTDNWITGMKNNDSPFPDASSP